MVSQASAARHATPVSAWARAACRWLARTAANRARAVRGAAAVALSSDAFSALNRWPIAASCSVRSSAPALVIMRSVVPRASV